MASLYLFESISMLSKTPIRISALLLLLVFASSTVIGFACSVGTNLYLSNVQREKKTHDHKGVDSGSHHHAGHAEKHEHSDTHPQDNQHHALVNTTENKDDCCNDGVIKFEQLDKSLVQVVKVKWNSQAIVGFLLPVFTTPEVAIARMNNPKIVPR